MAVAIAAGSSYFLSGVMQGKSASGDGVEGTVNQDYRAEMKAAILAADATAVTRGAVTGAGVAVC